MPQYLKYHPHGKVLYITSSIEQGLLFLCNPACEALLRSCLVAALALYKVKLCHFVIEATHFHMIIVVEDPEDVSKFIGFFKQETAHRINRMVGRKKRTVWCDGFDSPVVLTPLRALLAISYLYANPGKDNLAESIDTYEGCSSWKMFTSGNLSESYEVISRDEFKYIPLGSQNERGYEQEAKRLLASSDRKETLTIEPNAWLEAFGIIDPKVQLRWNSLCLERVRKIEARASKLRKSKGTRPMSAFRHRNQKFDLNRQSIRSGKRSVCVSERKKDRREFMKHFWELVQKAKEVVKRWKLGDFSVPYPPGLYAPNMPRLANILP